MISTALDELIKKIILKAPSMKNEMKECSKSQTSLEKFLMKNILRRKCESNMFIHSVFLDVWGAAIHIEPTSFPIVFKHIPFHYAIQNRFALGD